MAPSAPHTSASPVTPAPLKLADTFAPDPTHPGLLSSPLSDGGDPSPSAEGFDVWFAQPDGAPAPFPAGLGAGLQLEVLSPGPGMSALLGAGQPDSALMSPLRFLPASDEVAPVASEAGGMFGSVSEILDVNSTSMAFQHEEVYAGGGGVSDAPSPTQAERDAAAAAAQTARREAEERDAFSRALAGHAHQPIGRTGAPPAARFCHDMLAGDLFGASPSLAAAAQAQAEVDARVRTQVEAQAHAAIREAQAQAAAQAARAAQAGAQAAGVSAGMMDGFGSTPMMLPVKRAAAARRLGLFGWDAGAVTETGGAAPGQAVEGGPPPASRARAAEASAPPPTASEPVKRQRRRARDAPSKKPPSASKKRRARAADAGGEEEVVLERCVRCNVAATGTPMMRKGPDGARSLCNACGLKWKRHGIF